MQFIKEILNWREKPIDLGHKRLNLWGIICRAIHQNIGAYNPQDIGLITMAVYQSLPAGIIGKYSEAQLKDAIYAAVIAYQRIEKME